MSASGAGSYREEGLTVMRDELLNETLFFTIGQKRAMAIREFALGLEALRRFVEHAPLTRVHQCVFGVLAMETEPVDPRL